MSASIIKKIPNLHKRINRFLSSNIYGRSEVSNFIETLKPIGNIALFGGMLRDLSLSGNIDFNSDIDLVISGCNQEELENVLKQYNLKKNKFGGYRITLSKWKVDLWQLESTWAFKNGHVKGCSFESLCETTFFDWDAIVFDIKRNKIIATDHYIERLNSGILDINLIPNPNPLGNAIKAFRYCEKYNATLTNRLASYVFETIRGFDEKQISSYENNTHDWPILSMHAISNILQSLKEHQDLHPLFPFKHSHSKYDLLSKLDKTRH